MATKIVEQIVEPSKIISGSIFKIKIRAIRYMTYEELSKLKVSALKTYTVSELKGAIV